MIRIAAMADVHFGPDARDSLRPHLAHLSERADLLLIDGNPLRKVELLRDRSRIAGVMKAGRFVAGPLRQPA